MIDGFFNIKKYFFLTKIILLVSQLSSCTPIIISGAAVSAVNIVYDRRTPGTQLDDKNLSIKINFKIQKKITKSQKIGIHVYNRKVLLIGAVDSIRTIQKIEKIVQSFLGVKSIVNELTVKSQETLTEKMQDIWLNTKIKTELLKEKKVPFNSIKIIVNQGIVYLLGLVNLEEANQTAQIVSTIDGVKKVVKVFDIINQEEENLFDSEFKKEKNIVKSSNLEKSNTDKNVEIIPVD